MAKKCMEYRELRRKYPNQVRNTAANAAGARADTCEDSACAVFALESSPLKVRFPA